MVSDKQDIKIRPGCEDDLERVREIVRQVWNIGGDYSMEQKFGLIGNKPWQGWISESISSYIKEAIDCFLVAECEGKIAGFIAYRLDKRRNTGTVGYNAVDTAFRGRAIGSLLVGKVLATFREKGMIYANVSTGLNDGHAAARRMYEKAGFEPLTKTIGYAMKL